ncbi:hypothetical protein [Sphingobacterium kitahiroshimense]|uniref:hypothetical protein n=1 Tax=Sphingobacterium kitahiroshimense TaxID=470446 RepID=UPI00320AE2AA
MKKRYYILMSLIVIIFLSNIPPLRYTFDWLVDETHYKYATASGNFCVIDRSGNNISGVKGGFKESMDPEKLIADDTLLCRLFWKNPLAFWRYHSYLDKNDPRYKIPYKSEEEIEKRKKEIADSLKNHVN